MSTDYRKTVLPNGIRVVTEYMPHVRSVSLGAWLLTGSRDETLITNGLSHFMEHMVFKGTANRSISQIAESLESVGGSLNAFTGKEFTCYYAHVLDEHVTLSVEVIADLVSNSIIAAEEIKKEKQVVIEEINSLEDTPDELIHEYFQKDIFFDHPLALSILGSQENVHQFNRDLIIEFRQNNYTSNNLVIAAAGNINHETLIYDIQKNFKIPEGTTGNNRNGVLNNEPTYKVYTRNINQTHICVGNKALSYSDPRKYALLILHSILGGGMSSRLFQNIREKYGVAYTIFSFADFYLDTGLFGVYIGVDKSNIQHALDLINQEFSKVIRETIPDKELTRYKSQLKGGLMLGLENTYSRMNRLAKMEIYLKRYVNLDEVIENIGCVSADDVKELSKEILDGSMFSTIIMPE